MNNIINNIHLITSSCQAENLPIKNLVFLTKVLAHSGGREN